jgi:hypothetical protein
MSEAETVLLIKKSRRFTAMSKLFKAISVLVTLVLAGGATFKW